MHTALFPFFLLFFIKQSDMHTNNIGSYLLHLNVLNNDSQNYRIALKECNRLFFLYTLKYITPTPGTRHKFDFLCLTWINC